MDHRLLPGTRLGERELVQLLGASRSAVRNALARLGHELLVELRPNRGALVANPSVAETRDLFEGRRIVESAIVRSLADTLVPEGLARLRAFVDDEQRAYDRGDSKGGQRLSIRFHKVLSDLAGNSVLDRFMEHLICRTPLLVLAHRGTHVAYCGAHEHRSVVEALANRDAGAAARLMNEHLSHLENQLRLEEHPHAISLDQALLGLRARPRARVSRRPDATPRQQETGSIS